MTLFYAFTYFFWYYSCSTEQYTSAVLQTLLMVLWAFRWERTRADKYLYLLAFMAGLCLANRTQKSQRLQCLSQTHFVRQYPAELIIAQKLEPGCSVLLIRPEHAF